LAILREVYYIGWVHQNITEGFELMHRYEKLNFKNNTFEHGKYLLF
jgi:hypothetical protein